PGIALAIADRVDNLVGGFASGLQPTGTRDPFGLRRSAFGLLRIVAERAPALDLGSILDASLRLYPKELQDSAALPAAREFLWERLDSLLQEAGHKADVIRAVLAVAPLAPEEVFARAAALSAFRSRPEAAALAAAHKRIANILRHADQTGETAGAASGDEGDDAATRREGRSIPELRTHTTQAAERELREALKAAREGLRPTLSRQDFAGSLEILASLRPSVDRFFDEVLVMDPEPARRAQLLALLRELRAQFLEVADIGLLQESDPA
ncbi:MAG TPA: glycine--tRNA ligase subunit beta, partial [Bryobacteraceae bacterium]|nr:glycine--tRNA ligase subunit beta [Bryobacteraceae bacterium]